MINLNVITYNEDFTIASQTEQPIRAFAEQANTIKVKIPTSSYNTAFVIYQGLKNTVVNPLLRATERLFMSPLDDEGDYSVWQSTIPGGILNDMSLMKSTGVRVLVELWYIDGENALGVEKYNTEVGIADLLAADYPDATDGQFVRVIDTDTDWYYDLATDTWIDYEDKYLVGIVKAPTSAADFALEKGIYTGAPSHSPTNTELILEELKKMLRHDGSRPMTGDIDMDNNDILNSKTVTFYNVAGTAVVSFDGTNLVLNRDSVDEEIMTVLNEIGDLANVVITSAAADNLLVYNGTNWVNISKTDFLANIQSQVTTNTNNIVLRELLINKATDFTVVNDTKYPSVEAVKEQLDLKESLVNKGATNGYAPLVGGKVPAAYVPNAYDDFIEVATYADLPVTGQTGFSYTVVADETSGGNTSTYRWTGSVYVKISEILSASELKTLYESNDDTNAYTDAEKLKLAGLPDEVYSKTEFSNGSIPEINIGDNIITPRVTLATGVYFQHNATDNSIDFVIE